MPRLHSRYDLYKDYPEYHRSPRIIYRSSEDKILINPPGAEPQKPSDELLKLIMPPLIMVGVTPVSYTHLWKTKNRNYQQGSR